MLLKLKQYTATDWNHLISDQYATAVLNNEKPDFFKNLNDLAYFFSLSLQ